MTLHVVYDTGGRVIALGEPSGADVDPPISAGAMALPGQHAAELEVPRELADVPIHELLRRVEVDTSSEHRLRAKPS